MTADPKVAPKTVLALLGTDWHRFNRLVRWLDDWTARQPPGSIRCVIQYGASVRPQLAEGVDYWSTQDVAAQIRAAEVVVCHGGPATITEIRSAGKLPIVVPRNSALGEHVDDHQLLFASRISMAGMIRMASTEPELVGALNAALRLPQEFVVTPGAEEARRAAAVRAFAGEVATLTRPPGPSTDRPVVLYLGGFGRSGSTLLDRMLGEVPGLISSGEVVHLWERGVLGNERCGCGANFLDCPLWTEVGRKAFGGWDALDIDSVIRLKQSVDRNRYIPAMFASAAFPGYRRRLRDYADLLGQLYSALQEVSGARVIVDSSKHASYGYLLEQVPDVDLRLVHAVRDPRGVANSWGKQRRRPEVGAGESFMPLYSPSRSGILWTAHNAMVSALARRVPSIVVRYEDLIGDPRQEITRVLDLVGMPGGADELAHVTADAVTLRPSHTVAGNPMRFRSGHVVLRRDDGWRRGLAPRSQALVQALSWPLRRRYGYH